MPSICRVYGFVTVPDNRYKRAFDVAAGGCRVSGVGYLLSGKTMHPINDNRKLIPVNAEHL